MRRAAALALALIAAAAGISAAPGAGLPRLKWKVSRPIILPRLASPALVYLPLDAQALTVGSLSEYRVVRGAGVEVPYNMVVEQGRKEVQAVPVMSVARGLGERQVQLTITLGAGAPPANQVRLRLTGNNFRARVRVEGSRDGNTWWRLENNGLVYRHEIRLERTAVSIPTNDYRFLRVTLFQLQGKLPAVGDVSVSTNVTVARKLVPVPAKLSVRQEPKHERTVLTLRPGRLTRDLAEARLDVAEPAFDRSVTILAAGERQPLQWVGESEVRRLNAQQAVIMPVDISAARRLRLYIMNGDDRPLTIRGVSLWSVRRGLVFRAEPGRSYALWYGRPRAAEPVYDIRRLPITTPPDKMPRAGLGPEHRLPPPPPPPTPWSEKHRTLFWGVLAVVLMLLAIVILRAMRGVRAASPGQ